MYTKSARYAIFFDDRLLKRCNIIAIYMEYIYHIYCYYMVTLKMYSISIAFIFFVYALYMAYILHIFGTLKMHTIYMGNIFLTN